MGSLVKKIIKILIVAIIIFASQNIYSLTFKNRSADFSKGPLYGKNMYIPYMIYYNFPGLRARGGKRFEFQYHFSMYLTNDFFIEDLMFDIETGEVTKVFTARDYESFNVEFGSSFYILKNLQVGSEFRLISYFGGFLDNIIEAFHGYGKVFPNAGREYEGKNLVNVNIENINNVSLKLDKATVSFGDIDLWVKYTFLQKKRIALAVFGAFKIPSGRLSTLSGSNYPDFAVGILADFRPAWIISFYLQSGLVVPFDSFLQNVPSNPYPMFNGMIGVELHPVSIFSLTAQFNIKSPPMASPNNIYSSIWGDHNYLLLPQINTLVGVVFRYRGFKWQIYVEEDSFTNAGVDITLNFMFSHAFVIR